MSSYKPKSLDELNSMYDKALSAQRAIKRGTSKINETNSSDSFFDDVIKEAELAVQKEPEKRIADLSVAVDDFIKHFSEPKNEAKSPVVSTEVQSKAKPAEASKAKEAPKIKTEKKAAIVAAPSPEIARKQSGEHISSLMSDYIKIMNDQDDSDEDEPRQRKSFLARKKDKKAISKEAFKEEEKEEEDNIFDEPSYTPLSDEMKEDVFPFENSSVSFDELSEEKPSAASEEAFNAFSAMSRKKETFHKEIVTEEPAAEEIAEVETTEEAPDFSEAEETEAVFDDLSSNTEAMDDAEEESEAEDEEYTEEDFEEEFEQRPYSKGKNALRVITRVLLSVILVCTVLLSLCCASLSTVFNVNTGKEVFGQYYFFTSSHDFDASGVKAGDMVICKAQSTVSDDETAVYIDLENRTFSFGVKDGSITNGEGDIIYLIGDNEVLRDDVLGVVHKTVPTLGDVVMLVYEHYVAVISVLVSVSAILLLVIIFALKKRRAESEEYFEDEEEYEQEDAEEAAEENEAEAEEDADSDIFAQLD